MGDRTPEVNLLGKLTSKYLTPCRTFGLKRRNTPKSNILKKLRSENNSSLVNGKPTNDSTFSRSTTDYRTSSPTCKNDLENNVTPIKPIEMASPLVRVEQKEFSDTPCSSRKLALKVKKQDKIDSEITPVKPKRTLSLNVDQCQTTPKLLNGKLKNEQASSLCDTPVKSQHIIDETNTSETQILTQIRRINDKYNRLAKLKQEQIYTRKHNLTELQKSTDKWLSAFKEIAMSLHSELQERGRSCTIFDVLVDHNVPPERVGFNVESLEFE